MRGEVAEGEHGVRLAAAHGLPKLEHRLVVEAREPLEALAQELSHAVGDVGALEELACGGLVVVNEIAEILDLLGQRVVERLLLELAGVCDRLKHASYSSPFTFKASASWRRASPRFTTSGRSRSAISSGQSCFMAHQCLTDRGVTPRSWAMGVCQRAPYSASPAMRSRSGPPDISYL